MIQSIKLKVRENTYTIEFPNVGQLIDIEKLKAILSGGMYGQMEAARTKDSQFALDMIDMEANFSILIPNLIKDLKVKSFGDLAIEDAIELKNAFIEQLLPFINKWREIINKPIKTSDEN